MFNESTYAAAVAQKKLNQSFHCPDCYAKQQKIDALTEENNLLKQRLYSRKKLNSLADNAHVPSSKVLFKPNINKEKGRPGAKPGHKGNKRKPADKTVADRCCRIEMPTVCPECREDLRQISSRQRRIIDLAHEQLQTIVYDIGRAHCYKCHKTYKNPIPALEKGLLGNNLLSHAAVLHYFDNIPLGKITKIYDNKVNESTLISNFHRLGKIFEPCYQHLIETYRVAKVKHADETGWRTMGRNGYAWIFCSKYTSVFDFADNRSGQIVRQIVGNDPLSGVLVVDRYAAYNKAGCQLQYCFAHLLREAEQLKKEFPYSQEVRSFVDELGNGLTEAMHLQHMPIDDVCFYESASTIRRRIESLVSSPAKHDGVIRIKNIFQQNSERLYAWTKDREVPAHNNFAERMIRSTVIARKVSHGSFSEQGRKTRSHLMSLFTTAHCRLANSRHQLLTWFKKTLDTISATKSYSHELLPPIPGYFPKTYN